MKLEECGRYEQLQHSMCVSRGFLETPFEASNGPIWSNGPSDSVPAQGAQHIRQRAIDSGKSAG